jgi:hypothetical protein
MGVLAVVTAIVAAMPFGFLIFGRKKKTADESKPIVAAAPAAAPAASEEVDVVQEPSGEADVFADDSNEFDLGTVEEIEDDEQK